MACCLDIPDIGCEEDQLELLVQEGKSVFVTIYSPIQPTLEFTTMIYILISQKV